MAQNVSGTNLQMASVRLAASGMLPARQQFLHRRIGVAAHQSIGDRLAVAFGALWSRHGSSVLAANRGTDLRALLNAEHGSEDWGATRRHFTLMEGDCPRALDSQKPTFCVKKGVCLCFASVQ